MKNISISSGKSWKIIIGFLAIPIIIEILYRITNLGRIESLVLHIIWLVGSILVGWYWFYNGKKIEIVEDQLQINNQLQHVSIEFNEIVELFYLASIDKTMKRSYEKPVEYQIVTRNHRYSIDLSDFHIEKVVRLNIELENQLGSRYYQENSHVRKVANTNQVKQQRIDREFIRLDTLDE